MHVCHCGDGQPDPRADDEPVIHLVPPAPQPAVPQHVALLGLGPSCDAFTGLAKRAGGRHAFCDEVWCINALGDVIACDRVFHMDDVRIQEIRAAARPQSNIARMLEWLRTHPGPVYTSRGHPDYPGLVEFPLAEVIARYPFAYFNSTAAYAVAFALYLGVKKLSVFGFDFTYQNAHHAERGRACVEWWLGFAAAHGMSISLPHQTSLMDRCNPEAERLYGYDTLTVDIKRDGPETTVTYTPKDVLPTADEVEAAYDHTNHPNPLASAA